MIIQGQILMWEVKLSVIKKFWNLIFVIATMLTILRGDITIIRQQVTEAAFKNCAQFTKCITQTDGTTIDDAEDLRFSHTNVQFNRI